MFVEVAVSVGVGVIVGVLVALAVEVGVGRRGGLRSAMLRSELPPARMSASYPLSVVV